MTGNIRSAEQVKAEGFLALVNKEYPLPDDYEPDTLVNLADKRPPNVIGLKNTSMEADETAFAALCELAAAMKQEGYEGLTVIAAYRTKDYQQGLYQEENGDDGKDAAGKPFVQTPEATEHRTGLAFDLSVLDSAGMTLTFEDTPHYKYCLKHMHEYGFILRYPEDKQEQTGIGYEPWHIRYVGLDAAKEIQEQGLCLEEYLAALRAGE